MQDPLKEKQRENFKIKTLATIFNAVAVLPLVAHAISRGNRFNPPALIARHLAPYDEYEDNHPVAKIVKDMGRNANIKIKVYGQRHAEPFFNMRVWPTGASKQGYGDIDEALILIDGDPLLLPDGENVLKSAVDHEIEHIKQSNSFFHGLTFSNILSYSIFGLMGPFALVNDFGPQSFLLTPVCLGIAAGMVLLRQYEMRNNEYLADLASFRKNKENTKKALLSSISKAERLGIDFNHKSFLGRLLSTHPHPDDRIEILDRAAEFERLNSIPAPR